MRCKHSPYRRDDSPPTKTTTLVVIFSVCRSRFFQIRDGGRGRGTAVPGRRVSSSGRPRQQFCRMMAYDAATDNSVVTVAAAISPSTTSRESFGTICNVTARMAVDQDDPTAQSAPLSTAKRNISIQFPSTALSAYDMLSPLQYITSEIFMRLVSSPQTHSPQLSANASDGRASRRSEDLPMRRLVLVWTPTERRGSRD